MSGNNLNNDFKELENIEPKIITNTYYDNYHSKNNLKTIDLIDQNLNTNFKNYNLSSNHNDERSNVYRFFKKLLILSNIEGNFVRIFGIDKLWIPILLFIKKILMVNLPILNKYIFKEKKSSLTITYTHFTSTYYNQQNNSRDYIIYKSILCFVFEKKPFGCKFTSNAGGNLMFFDQFDEIQISQKIWLSSKIITNNTSCVYVLELLSYLCDINEINNFIKYCQNKYKQQIQAESLITSGLKYYKYIGINNSNHQCMYDEYSFTETKTFSNIFFTDKDKLFHKIKYFISNEETYKLLGRPYNMGIMLYGKPGTGKTSCIKAIASLTKRHIIDVSLKKIKTQKELFEIFYNGRINGGEMDMRKKLFVLEEFDCIIDKLKHRKLNYNQDENTNEYDNYNENINCSINKTIINEPKTQGFNNNKSIKEDDSGSVDLESLLCLLDGTNELTGAMFIATTNYIDMIDRALIRPGRFDCCIEFDNATDDIIIQMINHFSKKNLKKLNKKKIQSKISTSSSSSNNDKLTIEHLESIKKYCKYNDEYVWSPAKISQICLFHIESTNYYNDVINDIISQYDNECKLL